MVLDLRVLHHFLGVLAYQVIEFPELLRLEERTYLLLVQVLLRVLYLLLLGLLYGSRRNKLFGGVQLPHDLELILEVL
jgi:hypothetical protein